ncbi:MAG: thioredoxin, partial [Actinobacteria bacterium]|nr:thioredoxin [Actinomycetota bacterium]
MSAEPHAVTPTAAPVLPDGLVVVVKQDCATCRMVVPVLEQLGASATPLTIYVQDDASFLSGLPSLPDADLAVSWHHEIETVPTLIRVSGGQETDRTVGWS